MENENVDTDQKELAILVLGNERFLADKKKLVKYSFYFASLFSENFKDHMQKEFKINFDITPRTLKHFLTWINHEGEHTEVVFSTKYSFFVRVSLEYFLDGYHSQLLDLLELSMIFMAEKLTEQIIEMLICMRPSPNEMLEIWILAEDLGLKALRDVALASCLDRFDEISFSILIKLPAENLLKLILNVNVRSSPERLQEALEKWKEENGIPKNLLESFSRFFNGSPEYVKSILQRKKQNYVQCIAGEMENGSIGVWSWNGKSLQEMAMMSITQILTMLEDNGYSLTGFQVIGRGFHIYLVGGELGIGSGRFNMTLWRYCPFSKQWYMVCTIPRQRRHMAVAFIKNKLYLFGGVGRHRCKALSVDIYNIHTGTWSKGSKVPQGFTNVPPSCLTGRGQFIYHHSGYCIYDPASDLWAEFDLNPESGLKLSPGPIRSFTMNKDLSLIGARLTNGKSSDHYLVMPTVPIKYRKLEQLRVQPALSAFTHIFPRFEDDENWVFDQQTVTESPQIISFGHSSTEVIVEVGDLVERINCDDEVGWGRFVVYVPSMVYKRDLKGLPANGFSQRLGCFKLHDPGSLHKLIPVPEQESISV